LPEPRSNQPSPQSILNGEVHNWYRIVQGYSDHLVKKLIDQFELGQSDSVIDPFCGTGTTLVECMKHGIDAIGIDANPSSCFSARVKTNWSLSGDRLLDLLEDIAKRQKLRLRSKHKYLTHPIYEYLDAAGMLERGWISNQPLRKAIAIKSSIESLKTTKSYKETLTLALIAEVVQGASNIKYGPELYCATKRRDADVYSGFKQRVIRMASDLQKVRNIDSGVALVLEGDARKCHELVRPIRRRRFSAAICSPPYPAEHDYTRNTRLELAFLGAVSDRESLRVIKQSMIRSHTKNIYKGDNDSILVRKNLAVKRIVKELERKTVNIEHGFGKLYSTVISEYFGGMRRHFSSILKLIKAGGLCAYVVGDQSSYLQVHVPTSKILSSIAKEVGFELIKVEPWRTRWSSSTSKEVAEHILILQKPESKR
jgi:hypothetical protein